MAPGRDLVSTLLVAVVSVPTLGLDVQASGSEVSGRLGRSWTPAAFPPWDMAEARSYLRSFLELAWIWPKVPRFLDCWFRRGVSGKYFPEPVEKPRGVVLVLVSNCCYL